MLPGSGHRSCDHSAAARLRRTAVASGAASWASTDRRPGARASRSRAHAHRSAKDGDPAHLGKTARRYGRAPAKQHRPRSESEQHAHPHGELPHRSSRAAHRGATEDLRHHAPTAWPRTPHQRWGRQWTSATPARRGSASPAKLTCRDLYCPHGSPRPAA